MAHMFLVRKRAGEVGMGLLCGGALLSMFVDSLIPGTLGALCWGALMYWSLGYAYKGAHRAVPGAPRWSPPEDLCDTSGFYLPVTEELPVPAGRRHR